MGKAISRSQMLAERRCGLKYYDQAVTKVGKDGIIDAMIRLLEQHYKPHPVNWAHCDWAMGNAIAEILKKPQVGISFNLDDVFDATEMQSIADRAGIDIKDYKPSWPRD